jgi:tRNA-binding EMAP/Myf-like protein
MDEKIVEKAPEPDISIDDFKKVEIRIGEIRKR